MSKLPHMQFYPGDWLKDPNVRRLSMAAKGFLIDALCLLHENEDRGAFSSAGNAWSNEEISRAIGGNCVENLALLDEVLAKGALRRNSDKAIYSKRIRRDEEIRKVRAKAGKKGGKQKRSKSVANGEQIPDNDNDSDNDTVNTKNRRPKDEQEVVDYCRHLGLPKSDGSAMWDRWEGNGFKNGGKAMNCWKATIRSWKANGYMASQKGSKFGNAGNGGSAPPMMG